jgi:hypothetical protein
LVRCTAVTSESPFDIKSPSSKTLLKRLNILSVGTKFRKRFSSRKQFENYGLLNGRCLVTLSAHCVFVQIIFICFFATWFKKMYSISNLFFATWFKKMYSNFVFKQCHFFSTWSYVHAVRDHFFFCVCL